MAEKDSKGKFEPELGEGPPPPPEVPEPIGEAPEPKPPPPPSRDRDRRPPPEVPEPIGEAPEPKPTPPIEPALGEGAPPPPAPPPPKLPDEPGGQVATVDGQKRFIEGSTMYEMGFRTQQEHLEAQRVGITYGVHEGSLVPEDSVLLGIRFMGKNITVRYSGETPEKHPDLSKAVFSAIRRGQFFTPIIVAGQKRYLTSKDATAFDKLSGKGQFAFLQDKGFIEKGARFVSTKDGKLTYQTGDSIKEERIGLEPSQIFEQFEQSMQVSADFKKNNTQLPDGQWIDNAELARLQKDWPDLHNALITGGMSAFNRQVRKMEQRQDIVDKRLAPYTTKEGVDIARFLRENPKNHALLEEAGFSVVDIRVANHFNAKNFGTGAPDYIQKDVFTRKYFKDKGWKYKVSYQKDSDTDLLLFEQRITQASEAHDKEFQAPMSHEQFLINHFVSNGWKYEINRGTASDKDVRKHDQMIRLASAEFQKKYGQRPIISEGIGNLGDMVVPGLYLAQNWKDLSAAEKAINIAIDAAFIAIIFGKPISAGVKTIVRSALSDGVTDAMKGLTRAIRRGDVTAIRRASVTVAEAGVTADRGIVPINRDSIRLMQQRAINIARNAEYIADAGGRSLTDKQILDWMKATEHSANLQAKYPSGGGKNWTQIMTEAMEREKVARGLARTVEIPISRSEARGFGLSEVDTNRIFSKVGDDRTAFRREAARIKADRSRISQEMDRMLREAERPKAFPKGAPAPSARFSRDFYTEMGKSLKSKYPNVDPSIIDDVMEKVITKGAKLSSAMIVIQAKINEALVNASVTRATELIKSMTPDRTLIRLNNEQMLLPLLATNPELVTRLMAQSSTTTNTAIENALGMELARAVSTKAITKTKAAALAKIKTATKTTTEAMAKALTEVKLVAETSTRVMPVTKTATKLVTKPVTKTVTKVVTRPPTKTILKTPVKIPPKLPPKAPPKVPPVLKPPPPIVKTLASLRKRVRNREISGFITFNMGWQRYAIQPPFTQADLIKLRQLSKAKGVSTETPQQSLEIVGKVPFSKVSFDLGVADGWIDVKKKTIHFTGKGEDTNVGARLESSTKGIEIDQEDILGLSQRVSRVKISKKKPKSKTKRLSDWDYMTTLKGYRP